MTPALRAVADYLSAFDRPWGFAGGWAIDLFRGRISREHSDIEVAVFRGDLDRLARLWSDAEFVVMVDHAPQHWDQRSAIVAPAHELHVRIGGLSFELLLNERDQSDWCYRRDLSIRMPMARVFYTTTSGLPALAPEVALLFKSKATRPKDELDFACVAALLMPETRIWLRDAVSKSLPAHPWLRRLAVDESKLPARTRG